MTDMTKRLNKRNQVRRAEAEVALFVKKYARKVNKNDPNDRSYDRSIEEIVNPMTPEELDRLLRGDDL
jgi:hypothetical protein